ncbi:MAG: alpha/beta hydrolase [Pigmentiphaga sp.]|nr:alpha/beta hydrolase [Pigmentiphaga sp.]
MSTLPVSPGVASPEFNIQDQWVPHPEGRIFVRRWLPAAGASGDPIVLMHDSLGCVALWRDFPAMLCQATGREVIGYDRLGFGQSDPRVGLPSLDFVKEEIDRYFPVLCESLGLGSFVVLGHSVGGAMGVECAAGMEGTTARCAALVSLSAQMYPENRTLEGIRAAREQFRDPAQLERLARYHGDKAKWVLDAWTESWLNPEFAKWSLREVLPRVSCPILAVHGDNDEYGTPIHTDIIRERSGGPVRVEIMADTGHVPQRERPAAVLGLVGEFLAALRPLAPKRL